MSIDLFSHLPKKVNIVEVGPRDGLQNESMTLSADQRIEMIQALADAGIQQIESGSFVSPKWVPQMADTDLVVKGTSNLGIQLPVLVPNARGLEAAIAAGVSEIAVFTATSESFCQKNTNCSVEESLERIRAITTQAEAEGIKVRGYVSTVLDCPYEGEQAPERTTNIAKALLEMGCYEISLGDTIGHGTPKRVAALLDSVSKVVPMEKIAVHFHDTLGQALANILVALQYGVSTVDSSVGGLGGCPYAKGASGNVATEDVLYMLHGMGIETGVDLSKVIQVSKQMNEILDKELPSKVSKAL